MNVPGINGMFQVKSGKYETTSTARALSPSNISWVFAAILKMTQGMTRPIRAQNGDWHVNDFALLRASLRPRQIHACPPESAGAAEPERRCAPLGQRRHKETGGREWDFLLPNPSFPQGQQAFPGPSLPLFGNHFILLLLKQSPVLSHFSFHNPVRVCSPSSSEQVRVLPSFSPRREGLLDPGWSFPWDAPQLLPSLHPLLTRDRLILSELNLGLESKRKRNTQRDTAARLWIRTSFPLLHFGEDFSLSVVFVNPGGAGGLFHSSWC